MRNRSWITAILSVVIVSVSAPAGVAVAAPAITLSVLNPRGEIAPPPVFAPQPRIADLSGKRVGIYWNGKAGGNYFWNVVEQLVKERIPNVTVVRYEGAYDLGETLAAKMAREVDAFFYGVGD